MLKTPSHYSPSSSLIFQLVHPLTSTFHPTPTHTAATMETITCGRWSDPAVSARPIPPSCSAPISYNEALTSFRSTGSACEFRQLPQDVPFLAPLYTRFELTYNSLPWVCWAHDHMNVAFAVCALYILSLIVGTRWMKTRPAFRLKLPLAVWNLVLAVFSMIGFLRTAPHLVYYMFARERGFYNSVSLIVGG